MLPALFPTDHTTNYICLPSQGEDYLEDADSFSDVLMEAAVITMTDTDCRNTNYNTDFINDQHICAGAQEVDGCVKDAGGALIVSDGGRFCLLGHRLR